MTDPAAGFQTTRLVVNDFTPGDAEAFVPLATEPDVAIHWAEGRVSDQAARQFVSNAVRSKEGPGRTTYELAIRLKPARTLIGECELGFFPDGREAELGFFVGGPWRRQGYATEAVKGLLRYGFETLNLRLIFGMTDRGNTPAERVMAKAGMRVVGTERIHDRERDHWRTGIRYEAAAAEYGR